MRGAMHLRACRTSQSAQMEWLQSSLVDYGMKQRNSRGLNRMKWE